MHNQQQPHTEIVGKDSLSSSSNSARIFVSLLVSSLLSLLGLGVILTESVTKLQCQRDRSSSEYCQITQIGLFGQSTKQDVLLHDIKTVTHQEPTDSEWLNILTTQAEEEIALNGFNSKQAEAIQSFLKDFSQKDLVLQQLYERRPYAIFIGGTFLLVGTFGYFEVIRNIKGKS